MITINGKKHLVTCADMSYEEIITRAGYMPDRIISVTYTTTRRGDCQRSWMVFPGKSIEIEAGMIINAADTGNA